MAPFGAPSWHSRSGDPHAFKRSSKQARRGRFLEGDYVGSGIATEATTFVVGTQNVYAINC